MPSSIGGVYALDKESGQSSNACLSELRRRGGTRRVGHTGTLDPLASGVLLVGIGRATRLIRYLGRLDKSYRVVIELGVETDSYDITGEVVARRDAREVTQVALQSALEQFRGSIVQIPPRFSAIKVAGTRSYARARSGESFELEARQVEISRLCLLEFRPGHAGESAFVELEIDCSAGTYVRSIAHDLGEALGVGGTVQSLRRTVVGPVDLASAQSLASFDWDRRIPLATLLPDVEWRECWDEASLGRIGVGASLPGGDESEGSLVGLVERNELGDCYDRLLALYRRVGDVLRAEVVFRSSGE
ncbi:MAG: tRNA pseudouridine(55) synthase TruB [Ferrimicrobium sp.]